MLNSRMLAAVSTALMILLSAASVVAQDGKTIFGENKKETTKAMRQIVKDLGLTKTKCTECHVKGDFAEETPKKAITRLMKTAFVDSLVLKGKNQFEFMDHDKPIVVMAQLKAQGEDAGIHLSATTADKKTHSKVLPLPKKDEAVTCATCHNGAKHILLDH